MFPVETALGVGCVDEVYDKAADDVGEEGGEGEEFGRGGELHGGGCKDYFFLWLDLRLWFLERARRQLRSIESGSNCHYVLPSHMTNFWAEIISSTSISTA